MAPLTYFRNQLRASLKTVRTAERCCAVMFACLAVTEATHSHHLWCAAILAVAALSLFSSIRSTRMLNKLDLWERSDNVLLYSIDHEEQG